MAHHSTKQKRPGCLVRGYRIRIRRFGEHLCEDSAIIWAADVPEQWQAVTQDSAIREGKLYRSGRVFRQFARG